MTRLRSLVVLAALALTVSACDSSGEEGLLADAEANLGQWTWIDVADGAADLAIYLEGGGACFNGATCATNPKTFGEADFTALAAAAGNNGLFSTASSNPVGAYNMVYVPYCTGDLHGGSFPNNSLLGEEIGVQQFVGHQNIQRAVALLTDELDTPGKVLLTGSSAGGFGTLLNFGEVADAFTDSDLYLVDDSGPVFFQDNVFSPQLASSVTALYNLPATLPTAPQLFQTDGLPGIYAYYASTYPDATFGLSSYLGDDVIQQFFGFGQAPGDPITDDEYAAGLRDVRSQIPSDWGTYFAAGGEHTFLLVPSRYAGTSAGVTYDAWLAGILAGSPTNVDPGMTAARGPLASR